MCTAKNVHKNVYVTDQEIYGVVVQPIEYFKEDPDVVLKTINPTETDKNKEKILNRAREANEDFSIVTFGSSYY